MGWHGRAVAWGWASRKPAKRVLVITGDGISMGSLATVAAQRPEPRVISNESMAKPAIRPPTSRATTGRPARARHVAGCGIADSATCASGMSRSSSDARGAKGPIFRVVKVMAEKLELVMPPQDGALLKDRFRQALLGPEG
jgi:hypothetical protein